MIYCVKDPSISCAIYDSPFSSLMKLAKQIAKLKTGLPKFIISGALTLIKSIIHSKANFDLEDMEITQYAEKCTVPALFLASKKDSFTNYRHTEKLNNVYKGSK